MPTIPDHLTPQCEVALGAIPEILDERGNFSAQALAECLTEAQQYLPPNERVATPVSTASAGQYLAVLRAHGHVERAQRDDGTPIGRYWRYTP